jgi:hypothetical protein
MMPRLPSFFALSCGAALVAACSTGASLGSVVDGSLACAPDAASFGPCCGKVALAVPASTFSVDSGVFDPCKGSSAYVLCDGFNFECEYVCAVPTGFTVQSGASQSCADDASRADAPSAQPVPFDGGSLALGPCSGDVVALIPAAACPNHCPGSVAYAVCSDGAYGECACNIPPGYTLVGLSEGGAPDAHADAPVSDGAPEGGG